MSSSATYTFSWFEIMRACAGTPKKVALSLIVVMLAVSVCVLVKWLHERGPELIAAQLMAGSTVTVQQQREDCAAWAGMSFKQKKTKYRNDPGRWSTCLCEGDECRLDRLYVTGKL